MPTEGFTPTRHAGLPTQTHNIGTEVVCCCSFCLCVAAQLWRSSQHSLEQHLNRYCYMLQQTLQFVRWKDAGARAQVRDIDFIHARAVIPNCSNRSKVPLLADGYMYKAPEATASYHSSHTCCATKRHHHRRNHRRAPGPPAAPPSTIALICYLSGVHIARAP